MCLCQARSHCIDEFCRIHILFLSDGFISCYIFLQWVCVELCVTLKTGTGGGEKKRARVGEGYGGFRGFEKGKKSENKRREERDSQQRHDDIFREMGHSLLSSYMIFQNFQIVFDLHFECTILSFPKCSSL